MAPGGELTGTEGGEARLEWRVTPWRRERGRAAAAAVIMLATVVGAWWFSGGQLFFGLLAFVILWGSLGPFFVTSRFVLDAAGAEVDSPFLKRRRPWSEFRSYYVDRHGATLSPFAGRSWLESYRSVRLLWGDREDEIRGWLRERLGEPAGG